MNKKRVAVSIRLDVMTPDHLDIVEGVMLFATNRTDWECVIDPHPHHLSDSALAQFDGVIARGVADVLYRRLRKLRVSMVNTLYAFGKGKPNMPGVYIDTKACGIAAAEHLWLKGFRRFAVLSAHDIPRLSDIGKAFSATVAALGGETTFQSFEHLHSNSEIVHVHSKFRQVVDPWVTTLTPPVAVLVDVSWAARYLVSAAEHHNLEIPQDVAVLCCEEVPKVLDFSPSISSIDCNYVGVGYESAALLERLMEGESVLKSQILVPPRGVIPRETTDHFAVEDEMVSEALTYISANLSHKIRIDHIADHLSTTPRTLQRRFESALGRGILEEIRRLRMEAAKRMIRDETLSIKHIAHKSGFGTTANMYQCFHNQLGKSPSQYRAQVVGNSRVGGL